MINITYNKSIIGNKPSIFCPICQENIDSNHYYSDYAYFYHKKLGEDHDLAASWSKGYWKEISIKDGTFGVTFDFFHKIIRIVEWAIYNPFNSKHQLPWFDPDFSDYHKLKNRIQALKLFI